MGWEKKVKKTICVHNYTRKGLTSIQENPKQVEFSEIKRCFFFILALSLIISLYELNSESFLKPIWEHI